MNDSPVAKRWTALKDLAECAVVVMCMCKKGKNVYYSLRYHYFHMSLYN
jgi:hypothetical protein